MGHIISQAAEELLDQASPVPSNGFVRLVDYMGSDQSIVQAARVSYGAGTKSVREDRGLIRYLMRHDHCYDDQTEVLIRNGEGLVHFIPWPDAYHMWLQGAFLEIAAFHQDTEEIVFERPREIVRFAREGEMYYVRHGQVDLKVTPDHKMFVRTKYTDWGLIPAEQIAGKSTIRYRKAANYGGETYPNPWNFSNEYAYGQLVGFFVGDGFAGGTFRNGISFHLRKEREVNYLTGVLTSLGVSHKISDIIWAYLPDGRDFFRQFYTDDKQKTLPAWVLTASTNFRRGVLDGLRNSDGTEKRGAWVYYTSSPELADRVQTLGVLSNQPFGVSIHVPRVLGSNPLKPMYRLNANSRSVQPVINQGCIQDGFEQYKGFIYCATVSTGILVVRRNDKTVICGNTTPFEMVVLKFHIKAPIFVVRQWIRHRTASVNEESGRYSIMKEEFHEPEWGDVGYQSKDNKQGRSTDAVPTEMVQRFLDFLKQDRDTAYAHYEQFLEDNIARELARIVLPLSLYSEFYWQMNLHNLLHFLRLRMDPHAQKEIRDYANQVAVCAQAVAPIAWEAFEEYRLHGKSFSRTELAILQRLLSGEPLPVDAFEGSKSLLREFEAKLGMSLTTSELDNPLHANGLSKV
jgi:thymidylate synthase (FAD)